LRDHCRHAEHACDKRTRRLDASICTDGEANAEEAAKQREMKEEQWSQWWDPAALECGSSSPMKPMTSVLPAAKLRTNGSNFKDKD
jgi:hypothetical protein